ncbi:hypothetical protein HK100_003231 [Physocladia obscura]|uniref:BZIP domain-containing protein n=1 Tax=Physocladia obscura TaxID=109957 RepID=A0AAD5SWX4_9FUNG|nr:hypothetical protein HK100_003231 [Physocladia obscura]
MTGSSELPSKNASQRRAEQNRLAQKAFRERKDMRIKELELKVAVLQELCLGNSALTATTNTKHSSTVKQEAQSPSPPLADAATRTLFDRIRNLEAELKRLDDENAQLRRSLAPSSSLAVGGSSFLPGVRASNELELNRSSLASDGPYSPSSCGDSDSNHGHERRKSFMHTVLME